jgi:hypothetical protein
VKIIIVVLLQDIPTIAQIKATKRGSRENWKLRHAFSMRCLLEFFPELWKLKPPRKWRKNCERWSWIAMDELKISAQLQAYTRKAVSLWDK